MPGLGNSYPRQITNYGSTRMPFALGVVSQLSTCGTLCFATNAGDFWIYLNGTDPLTPMFGGYTEIMSNPAGGVALATAVAKASLGFSHQRRDENLSIMGSSRVSSSICVMAPDKPALGLMWGSGANISYLFVVGATGQLRFGTEAEWIAGTGTLLATKAPSGKFDIRKDGRSYIAGNNTHGSQTAAATLTSGGRSAALVLASGDQTSAVALYTLDGAALTASNYAAWLTSTNLPPIPVLATVTPSSVPQGTGGGSVQLRLTGTWPAGVPLSVLADNVIYGSATPTQANVLDVIFAGTNLTVAAHILKVRNTAGDSNTITWTIT